MRGWTLSEHGKGEASTQLPFEDDEIESEETELGMIYGHA